MFNIICMYKIPLNVKSFHEFVYCKIIIDFKVTLIILILNKPNQTKSKYFITIWFNFGEVYVWFGVTC